MKIWECSNPDCDATFEEFQYIIGCCYSCSTPIPEHIKKEMREEIKRLEDDGYVFVIGKGE